jgi:hypothetical protein
MLNTEERVATVYARLHGLSYQHVQHHLQEHDYLNNTFQNIWIGTAASQHWAPRSPDLTPLGFFAWCFIRSKVLDLHDLWQRIYEAAQALTPCMLRDVFGATVERWEES